MAKLRVLPDDPSFFIKEASDSQYDSLTKSKKRKGGDVVAIFVHAGAGYHSISNEQVHLKACGDACQIAMKFLRAGATAVEAVEAAIRVLEDNDITNAGYGSNLSLDGTVECDASIVDHYGRSGAVGAIGQVMHPIHVARLILDGTIQRLTLRRVPPNLLVGQGAVDFAWENKVPVLPPDTLVSPAARERFRRWQQDLDEAEAAGSPKQLVRTPEKRVLAPLANEAQPPTPALISPSANQADMDADSYMTVRRSSPRASYLAPRSSFNVKLTSPSNGRAQPRPNKARIHTENPDQEAFDQFVSMVPDNFSMELDEEMADSPPALHPSVGTDGTSELCNAMSDLPTRLRGNRQTCLPFQLGSSLQPRPREMHSEGGKKLDVSPHPIPDRPDHVTDTVGAIAIDSFGRIAAASSSGGIGMKHKGRTGPAALVGIGTAVHPVFDGDKTGKTTAAVTSGTGEHMATTLAAGTCADRLYYSQKLAADGNITDAEDEELLSNFIKDGFMDHPSVRYSNTSAAIGVLAVKKTTDGVWFHFAHNTDSFALCSMTSEDQEPMALMSRASNSGDGPQVSTGGRSCTWYPAKKDGRSPKRRRKTGQRSDKAVDRQGLSNRTRSKILHALRPSNPAMPDTTSMSDDEKPNGLPA